MASIPLNKIKITNKFMKVPIRISKKYHFFYLISGFFFLKMRSNLWVGESPYNRPSTLNKKE
jgi:hypothetical protein